MPGTATIWAASIASTWSRGLIPLTTESMKFAPRSNGPLSWEALTKWQIIAAIATPTRSAMRSLVQVSHPQWRNAPRDYRPLGEAREGLEFSVERDATDAIDAFDASAPDNAEDDFRAAGESEGLSDHHGTSRCVSEGDERVSSGPWRTRLAFRKVS